MTNDAKLGLLAGLAGVIVSAVVYFQKPTVPGDAAKPAAVTASRPTGPNVPPAAVVVPSPVVK